MTNAFDPRIIKVSIDFGGGDVRTFQDLYIKAKGFKGTSSLQSGAMITILNMTPQDRNYIISKSSNRNPPPQPVLITLEVGRESTGTFMLYTGYATASYSLQPPDIGVTLNTLTNSFNFLFAQGIDFGSLNTVANIAAKIAQDNGLTLDFQASDKQVSNFNYTGATGKLLEELNDLGRVNAFIDNTTLVVLDIGSYRSGGMRLINAQNGMVGIPEVTTYGINCKMLIDNSIQIGGHVQVESEQIPSVNGDYFVYAIEFDVANRENPFWYDLKLYNPIAYLPFKQN